MKNCEYCYYFFFILLRRKSYSSIHSISVCLLGTYGNDNCAYQEDLLLGCQVRWSKLARPNSCYNLRSNMRLGLECHRKLRRRPPRCEDFARRRRRLLFGARICFVLAYAGFCKKCWVLYWKNLYSVDRVNGLRYDFSWMLDHIICAW